MISGSLGCGLVLLFLVYCAFEDLRAMSVSALAFLAMVLSELGWYVARLFRGGGADCANVCFQENVHVFLSFSSILCCFRICKCFLLTNDQRLPR